MRGVPRPIPPTRQGCRLRDTPARLTPIRTVHLAGIPSPQGASLAHNGRPGLRELQSHAGMARSGAGSQEHIKASSLVAWKLPGLVGDSNGLLGPKKERTPGRGVTGVANKKRKGLACSGGGSPQGIHANYASESLPGRAGEGARPLSPIQPSAPWIAIGHRAKGASPPTFHSTICVVHLLISRRVLQPLQGLRRSSSGKKRENQGGIGLMESTPGTGCFNDDRCRAARLCGSGVGYVASAVLVARLFPPLLAWRRGSWKSRRGKTFYGDEPSQKVSRRTNS